MSDFIDICSLDYLPGTLATAYKGLISSLIAKDFCILGGADGGVILKGTILSMPEGDYQAFLMQEGMELSRGALRQGRFELRTDRETIASTKNLQIDIIQKGRHIGTFLLKHEKAGGMYVSALELSEDIRGMNLQVLSSYLSDKPGLLKKAEEIISRILSPKKDWGNFSEKINSFAKDLFWSDREAFYHWFDVLSEYSKKAAETAGSSSTEKVMANFLFLISLPLEKESVEEKLRNMVEIWLRKVKGTSLPFSHASQEVRKVLTTLAARFPEADIGAVLGPLLDSMSRQAVNAPVISEKILDQLKEVLDIKELGLLARYGRERKKDFLAHTEMLEKLAGEKNFADLLRRLEEEDTSFMDDIKMTDTFFEVLERALRKETSAALVESVVDFFAVFGSLSADAYRRGLLSTARLIRSLIDSGLLSACSYLLENLEKAGPMVREDVLMKEEIAASFLQGGSEDLLGQYKALLKQIVVPVPEVEGFSNDTWAEIVPDLHLQRLAEFMSIIRLDGPCFRDVLVHLICNLWASGVFVPDDRLFQREVSSYLNSSGLQEDFLLHYLLLRKLPVFYNEVGASGLIRDYTTQLDSWGNDTVLYFLRKQVHVNASNYNISLIERVLRAWLHQDPEILRGAVPDEILGRLDMSLLRKYSAAMQGLLAALDVPWHKGSYPERLQTLSEAQLKDALKRVDAEEEILGKIQLMIRTYQEVFKKYAKTARDAFALAQGEAEALSLLKKHVARMNSLHEAVISPERTEAQESFYFKRHIAFGIPSVMGTYHESKFDAMAEMISTGESIRLLLEHIIASVEDMSRDFSASDLQEWISSLECMRDLFNIYGLGNFQVDEVVTVFSSNRLFLSQAIDLLRCWQRELSGMVEFFSSTFYRPFTGLFDMLQGVGLPERRRAAGHGGDIDIHRTTDVFIRDIMSSIAGFVELDRLLGGLVARLRQRISAGSDDLLSLGGPLRYADDLFVLDIVSEHEAMVLSPVIGGKAKGLAILKQQGLPVPHGVVFSAARTRDYLQFTEDEGFMLLLKSAVRSIEEQTDGRFGGAETPLFLSVRSGSYISMPGILSTILFCGMNQETLGGLVRRRGKWTAYDSYRRFIEDFGTVACGLESSYFDDILAEHMGRQNKAAAGMDADRMASLVSLYLDALKKDKIAIPDDVYEQLRQSVRAIYASWYAGRALKFRSAMDVSEHWGTSVLIMEMVCGNERNSGASVFFTREPSTMGPGIYGETRENAAGSDLVKGRLVNQPLAKRQATGGLRSLEETGPELFSMHAKLAGKIEKAMKGLPQEVEAVYTSGANGKRQMHVLQTKRMEIHRGFTKRFEDVCDMQAHILGRGVGVHGGALSGVATFALIPEEVRKTRESSGMPVVLLREMASTDDVALMPEIDGIITAAGGVSSHAAVLAQKFGLTAVVGCADMRIIRSDSNNIAAVIGGHSIEEGAVVSLDGSTGLVYEGSCGSFYLTRGG